MIFDQDFFPYQVALSDHELKAGLKVAPAEKEVTIVDEPISGVVFSQFRAKVSGTVTCLGEHSILLHQG